MNAKTISNAVLRNFSEENKQLLRDSLLSGTNFAEACQSVITGSEPRVGLAAIADFWQVECVPILMQRRVEDAALAESVSAAAAAAPGRFEEAAKHSLRQRLFNISLVPDKNTDEIKSLSGILLKDRAMALLEARLVMAKRRAELEEDDHALDRYRDQRTLAGMVGEHDMEDLMPGVKARSARTGLTREEKKAIYREWLITERARNLEVLETQAALDAAAAERAKQAETAGSESKTS